MLKHDQKYVVWDCETVSLNLHYTLPWQVSWITYVGSRKVDEQDRYLDWPNLVVPKEVVKLTGFDKKLYNSKKENPKQVLQELSAVLYDDSYKVVGQNLLGFDVYCLAILQRMMGVDPDYSYIDRIYDTHPLGKAYREGLRPPTSDLLSWQYKIINDRSLKSKSNQAQLLKTFGIPFEESKLHNSLYDCETCFKVFLALKKELNL